MLFKNINCVEKKVGYAYNFFCDIQKMSCVWKNSGAIYRKVHTMYKTFLHNLQKNVLYIQKNVYDIFK